MDPFGALVVGVVLFAASLRLVTTHTWGPRFGAVGAALTWLVPFQAGSDVAPVPDAVTEPAVVVGALALTALPFVVANAIDFDGAEEA